jgi:hypothetical protein
MTTSPKKAKYSGKILWNPGVLIEFHKGKARATIIDTQNSLIYEVTGVAVELCIFLNRNGSVVQAKDALFKKYPRHKSQISEKSNAFIRKLVRLSLVREI